MNFAVAKDAGRTVKAGERLSRLQTYLLPQQFLEKLWKSGNSRRCVEDSRTPDVTNGNLAHTCYIRTASDLRLKCKLIERGQTKLDHATHQTRADLQEKSFRSAKQRIVSGMDV